MAQPDPAAALPAILPVFPLTGSLLLPGNWLPLNVFEPRYRNMVEDAMAGAAGGVGASGGGGGGGGGGEGGAGGGAGAGGTGGGGGGGWIGLIQPLVPQQDNWPAIEPPEENPRLYSVGCAGRIERCEPQSDGRYHILLKGRSRFRVQDELPLRRGYRRVAVDYEEFAADLAEAEAEMDPARLLHAVRSFGKTQGLSFDLDVLAALPGIALLNGLAVALPFRPAEKQALLEATGPRQREEMLLAMMGMGLDVDGDYYSPPTVH
jgi:Lon protease-like protein